MQKELNLKEIFTPTVILAALGYFVDVYDLLLFNIVKKESLEALGYTGAALMENGMWLMDIQMIGMLIGGILWGVLGDKKGRLSVLFGSIFLYSVANFANAFVVNLEMYAVLRFLAGVGLAGELGAGITLVSETMSKEKRGYGTMVVAAIGVLGAICAGIVSKFFGWQMSYMIGGVWGFGLLFLRMGVFESGLFKGVKEKHIQSGNLLMLFYPLHRGLRFAKCILIGLPVWFIIGILISFSSVFAKELGVAGDILDRNSVMLAYGGLALGDLGSGFLSQLLKSRKKTLYIFYFFCALTIGIYLNLNHASVTLFYSFCFLMGFTAGFWAIFVTIASEQFGTNLRATSTTTVPNFVRASLVPVSFGFKYFTSQMGLINGTIILACIVGSISLICLYFLKETFGKNLDFMEE